MAESCLIREHIVGGDVGQKFKCRVLVSVSILIRTNTECRVIIEQSIGEQVVTRIIARHAYVCFLDEV